MDALPAPEGRRGEAGKKCVIRVVRVSGTVKKAEEEVVRRAKREIVRAQTMMGGGLGLERLIGDGKGSVGSGVKGAGQRDNEEYGIEDEDEGEEMEDESE
jgi:ribonuclease P/MRP protein subunit POP5